VSDRDHLFAASGYFLVLLDTLSTQILDIYQFSFFGYYVNLFTLIPWLVFQAVNRNHRDLRVRSHVTRSRKIYFWYILWSIVSGVFFEPINLYYYIFSGIAVTFLMIIVLIYVIFTTTRGLVRAFKGEYAPGVKLKNRSDTDSLITAREEQALANLNSIKQRDRA